jgi:hypothetical protein
MAGSVRRLPNGLIAIMKKSSMWLTGNGVDWVRQDGPPSSEELFSAKALITEWYSQPQIDHLAVKLWKSQGQAELRWTKQQDRDSW